MNITLVLQQKLYAAIRAVAERIGASGQATAPIQTRTTHNPKLTFPCPLASSPRRAATGSMHPRPGSKPLRVVRVFESGQAKSNVGRMVISGRMADVCAELDRLVAHEAKLH